MSRRTGRARSGGGEPPHRAPLPPLAPDAHVPVLLEEAVAALLPRAEGVWVDATFGRGGHTRALLARIGPRARVIALDRDPAAIAAGRAITDPRLVLVHAEFGSIGQAVRDAGESLVDGVLLDLGVSSPQLDDAARGFSFRFDAPLDMRMDPTRGESAADWLARASIEEMKGVIRDHGEERFAGQIAKAIAAHREREPIRTTRQLADVVGAAVRTREPGQDPATRTFQALRIHVNQELAQLALALPQALDMLKPGGRLAVISFHSLEDRIVKRFVQGEARPEAGVHRDLPLRASELPQPRLVAIGRAIRPGAAEIAANPRARSAVLRVAERTTAR
jgi:16S rRNA (cytosine1402-N4)-methyltransferase